MRDRHVFIWQSLEILNFFNTWTLKQTFWKTQTLVKKLEYRFLVESTKIENGKFPCKTALSEANVKTNRMVSTKWTYHKERSFSSNFLFFQNFIFSLRTSHKELIWCTNHPNIHIYIFRKRWSCIWGCFSLWVSLIAVLLTTVFLIAAHVNTRLLLDELIILLDDITLDLVKFWKANVRCELALTINLVLQTKWLTRWPGTPIFDAHWILVALGEWFLRKYLEYKHNMRLDS